MDPEGSNETEALERRVNRLADERTTLFTKAGTHVGLSKVEHQRLKTVERELDDCFALRRKQRAARDARRFTSQRDWLNPARRTP